ncbi:MAG: 50S ribosomal protein L3 [Chitinophagales bacterium]|nr:50S ribosomal protein L3 [Chitinophagales bacterium]
MSALIGIKAGMTSFHDENGKMIPVTVIKAGSSFVSQVKTDDTDGYKAVQLAFGEKKEKNTSKPMKGHFEKAGISPKKKLVEFRGLKEDFSVGQELTLASFADGEKVTLVGTSKGKGFQGVVKRHGFSGVGMRTHGQHDRLRAPGSMGASSFPSRVFKGKKMAGRTGNDRIKLQTKIVKVLADQEVLLVKGCIPGAKGSYVIIRK